MKKFSKLAVLVVVLSLLATATVVFAASPSGQGPSGPGGPGGPGGGHGRGPGGVSGAVTAIGADSLSVLTAANTAVTVTTTAATQVHILATGADGSLSDITVGSQVEVRGPRNQDGSVTAEVITLLPAGDQLGGRVTAVSGAAITVQDRDGSSAAITTTGATTFRKGQDAAALSDVQPGQEARAFGALQSDGSLLAALVLIQAGPDGPGGPGDGPAHRMGGLSGEVTAIGADSLTVLTAASTAVTVTTTANTQVHILATGADGSLSDITVGSQVEVRGSRNQDGSVTAEVITLLPTGDQLGGRVTAVSGAAITVQDRGGSSAAITTTGATTFRKGQDAAALSDVQPGQEVRAFGALQSDGSLLASLVLIQAGPPGGHH